jgi:hypothetical protein
MCCRAPKGRSRPVLPNVIVVQYQLRLLYGNCCHQWALAERQELTHASQRPGTFCQLLARQTVDWATNRLRRGRPAPWERDRPQATGACRGEETQPGPHFPSLSTRVTFVLAGPKMAFFELPPIGFALLWNETEVRGQRQGRSPHRTNAQCLAWLRVLRHGQVANANGSLHPRAAFRRRSNRRRSCSRK